MIKPESLTKPEGEATQCKCAATDEIIGYSPLHTENDLKQMLADARYKLPEEVFICVQRCWPEVQV